MMETEDMELVRQYAAQNSEDAFAALVSRHVNLVYSVALRQLGNSHLAEEVTQAAFIILARKASSLGTKTILSAWLCRTAQHLALRAVREQRRRQSREQEAYMQSTLNEPETDASAWPEIAPLLDSAMAGLSEIDHSAIVLRFFQDKDFKEVGFALGVNEGAARTRVSRAVEKLRRTFVKRGVVLSAAAIAGAITANSVQAAPVALAKSATAIALTKGATASVWTSTLIKGALRIMAWTKAKTAVVVIGAAVVLTAGTATSIIGARGVKAKWVLSHGQSNGVVAADRTTPKGTMLVMLNALENGDAKGYLDSFVFTTSDELALKPRMEAFVAATDRFNHAIVDKFGETAMRQGFPNMPFAFPTNMVVSLEENIQGDSATVTIGKKGMRPVQFTKVNGEWKMAADGFVHLGPAVMNDLYGHVIQALDQTTPEIPLNQFKTAADAVDKMKQRAR